MKYDLEADVRGKELWVYGVQHLIYFAAGTVILPIAVGVHLGLSQGEIAELLQRTFLLCGLTSLAQIKFGHGYPIIDGPAGLWASMLIIMAASAVAAGKPLLSLRTDLQMGIMIAGAVIMFMVAVGLIRKISGVFTPIVNGVVILLMVLQMSSTLMKGMLGLDSGDGTVNMANLLVFFVTTAVILFVAIYVRGFFQSIATLIGVIIGWICAAAAGLYSTAIMPERIFCLPEVWAWGTPTFNLGITINCVVSAVILLSMTFVSVSSMSEAVGKAATEKTMNASVFFHGCSTLLAGIFPSVPFMPFVSSTGVVLMTGVAAKKPFVLACILMIFFGIVSPVAAFFASMPAAVAYSTSIIIFALIFGQGLKEFTKIKVTNRESYIIGISMILGMGAMFLPEGTFHMLPQAVEMVLANGLIVGTLMALLLEQILRIQRPAKK